MDLALSQRTVFVSGSHRGTGLIIAERFLQEGARVIVHAPEPSMLSDLDPRFDLRVTGALWTDEGTESQANAEGWRSGSASAWTGGPMLRSTDLLALVAARSSMGVHAKPASV